MGVTPAEPHYQFLHMLVGFEGSSSQAALSHAEDLSSLISKSQSYQSVLRKNRHRQQRLTGLGSNPDSATYGLRDAGHATSPL